MHSQALLIAVRLGLGLLTWTAIAIQAARHISAGFPLLNFVNYFTVLSNAIAGTVLLIGAYLGLIRKAPPAWYDSTRGAATLYMTVVGLVFVTLLRKEDLGNLLPWINTVHHYLMPVMMVADWVFVSPAHRPMIRDVIRWFIFPVVYVVYTLVRGAQIGWYPYPFLNPAVVGGAGVVALYVAAMLATFMALGLALRWSAGRSQIR